MSAKSRTKGKPTTEIGESKLIELDVEDCCVGQGYLDVEVDYIEALWNVDHSVGHPCFAGIGVCGDS